MDDKKFKITLENLLKKDARFVDKNKELNLAAIKQLANKNDEQLIALLLSNKEVKHKFFLQLKEVIVFKNNDFKFFLDENKIDNSYTAYENRIGLSSNNRLLKDSGDVVLNFPYKDSVLEGGQSTEEGMDEYYKYNATTNNYETEKAQRKEIFFNEVIAKDEIDRLEAPKAFTNIKKYTAKGEEKVKAFTRDANGTITDNLIIKGNNLLALHSLKTEFTGKIKLIYIDPPYNTGNDGFKYNDNFNHSTWLVFMKNRLEVAKELLKEDGVFFVQCDDNEQAYLKVLCDEVFGIENFLNVVCVKMKQTSGASGGGEDKRLKKNIEFVNIYSKNKNSFTSFNESSDEEELFSLINSMKEEGKSWKYTRVLFGIEKREFLKDILDGSGETIKIYRHKSIKIKPISELAKEENISIEKCYVKYFKQIFRDTNAQSSIRTKVMEATVGNDCDFFSIDYLPKSGRNKKNITTLYYKGRNRDLIAWLKDVCIEKDNKIFKLEKAGTLWDGINLNNLTKEGKVLFESGKKPEELLKRIIEIASSENDIILDYHLGSGTTAATAHKMNRQYIGIEQLNYGNNDSVARLKNVVKGDASGISKAMNWQGGGSFVYLELVKWNEEAKEKIAACKSLNELETLLHDLAEKYFLHYNVRFKEFEEKIIKEEIFKKLPLQKQQEMFCKMLDLNQMYVNASEMEDKKYGLSKEDITLTKNFYNL